MQNDRLVTLSTLNSGAVLELFEEEFEKALKNIADDNTSPTAVRAITIKIELKPMADRSMATSKVKVSSSLAPMNPHESTVSFAFNGRSVEAYVNGPINQPDLDGINPIPFERRTVGEN
ncbi:hypothetical protein K7J14_08475 [Treponema zuelzerae]|uniref:Uncharacterized protein n=1 Tax=Teretinema zuelzerae TaxID=156 RepID=A0AAE3EGW7_9SPIR|nr:hypothetical protein [Teretinema zuelzerae]MCD1654740.1 hypothetical protein [Teretinema zuelzerae]